MTRPGGVTAAAVVAILGSVFALLLGAGFAAASFVTPTIPAPIPNYQAFTITVAGISLVLGGLGIATGIGVLRLRPWARTSMLVFAGFAAPLCLLTSAVAAIVPLPTSPGAPGGMEGMIRAVVVGIYALPLLVTIWWLVQFNTKRTKEAFAGGGVAGPSRPIIVPIVGWGNLIGGVSCLLPVAVELPFFLAGFVVQGIAARLLYLVFAALSIYLGAELLRMRERARPDDRDVRLFWPEFGVRDAVPCRARTLQRDPGQTWSNAGASARVRHDGVFCHDDARDDRAARGRDLVAGARQTGIPALER